MPEATPISRVGSGIDSKVERAYTMIRDRILDASFAPGQRLVIRPLAAELGVSPVPVREAIRRLEAERFIVFTRNVGATVRVIDLAEYRWALETLAITEGAATGLAAPHTTPEAIARARELNGLMRAGIKSFDPGQHSDLNHRFHQTLSEACPNTDLLNLVRRGWAHAAALRSSMFAFVGERAASSVSEHDQIIDAIEAKAPEAEIESLARRHRLTVLSSTLQDYDAGAPARQDRPVLQPA